MMKVNLAKNFVSVSEQFSMTNSSTCLFSFRSKIKRVTDFQTKTTLDFQNKTMPDFQNKIIPSEIHVLVNTFLIFQR